MVLVRNSISLRLTKQNYSTDTILTNQSKLFPKTINVLQNFLQLQQKKKKRSKKVSCIYMQHSPPLNFNNKIITHV